MILGLPEVMGQVDWWLLAVPLRLEMGLWEGGSE
jgi:hypothetical protein